MWLCFSGTQGLKHGFVSGANETYNNMQSIEALYNSYKKIIHSAKQLQQSNKVMPASTSSP